MNCRSKQKLYDLRIIVPTVAAGLGRPVTDGAPRVLRAGAAMASNPFAGLGSDSEDESLNSEDESLLREIDVAEDEDAMLRQLVGDAPEPEPELELTEAERIKELQFQVKPSDRLVEEMTDIRFAEDVESKGHHQTKTCTDKATLKKMRKEQRRAARHAEERAAAAATGASAAAPGSEDEDADDGIDDGSPLSDGAFRARHQIKLYALGDSAAPPPLFGPVQDFHELSGKEMAGGVAIAAALVEACVSTIGDGKGGADLRPSPVQAECWGALLGGAVADLVATSYTGSGKTLAFLLPAFAAHAAAGAAEGESDAALVAPFGLVLAPTRELCLQIAAVAAGITAHLLQQATAEGASAPPRVSCVVGGVDYVTQREQVLQAKPTLIAATPGRLLALCGLVPASTRARQVAAAAKDGKDPPPEAELNPESAIISLETVKTLVLDEADRMLDLGFADDIEAIAGLIASRDGESFPFLSQPVHPSTWMFSATWPQGAQSLASKLLLPGATHVAIGSTQEDVGPDGESGQKLVTAATVEQRFEKMSGKGAPRARRLTELLEGILGPPTPPGDEAEDKDDDDDAAETEGRVLVFVMYKKEASDIAKMLISRGFLAVALQGDMSQTARNKAMGAFRSGASSVLVATDVAARGLDVSGISHVINFSFGLSVENYVHRVGRCGRAGRKGVATTFFVDGDEKFAPDLLELLHRSAQAAGQRTKAPAQWLRELAGVAVAKEEKKVKKAAKGPLTEEEEMELERKIENRQWQREQQMAMKAAERNQTKEGSKYDREREYEKRVQAREQRQRNTRGGDDDEDSDDEGGRAWDERDNSNDLSTALNQRYKGPKRATTPMTAAEQEAALESAYAQQQRKKEELLKVKNAGKDKSWKKLNRGAGKKKK